eukprot:g1580.t1
MQRRAEARDENDRDTSQEIASPCRTRAIRGRTVIIHYNLQSSFRLQHAVVSMQSLYSHVQVVFVSNTQWSQYSVLGVYLHSSCCSVIILPL